MHQIAGRFIDVTDEEWEYIGALQKTFGKSCLEGLFESSPDGKILTLTPPLTQGAAVPQQVMFFLMNVCINQQLRIFEKDISVLKKQNEKLRTDLNTALRARR
jgi:hypothetical protein